MTISFHGAAQTVTGSKHLITFPNGKKILLDCGMFQGLGKETITLNQEFGFEPSELDAVILSHAHIDHVGLLPRLMKQGFDGSIYCTVATAAFAEVLLMDSAYIQEMDIRHVNKRREQKGLELFKPLYKIQDVPMVIHRLVTRDFAQWYTIFDDIEIMFLNAGHILGSSTVHIRFLDHSGTQRVLSFSGDIGRYNDDILPPPVDFPQSDIVIMESTYGDTLHEPLFSTVDHLLNEINHTCVHKRGKLIIPAFSVGRTQEILYILNQLELENRLPKLKYYLDSPMSIEITELTKQFPNLFNKNVKKVLEMDKDPFAFEGLIYIEDVIESKRINFSKEPCVIISASGMAEAGRVKHHIANSISDSSHTILIVGYCEPQSLGGRLAAGSQEVGIFGERYEVKAEVKTISTLSAHGDYSDLMKWLSCQNPKGIKKLFLVHGEREVQEKLKDRLKAAGYKHIHIPEIHEEINLDF